MQGDAGGRVNNLVLIPHSHIESADALCRVCVDHEKREMALMFRTIVARMKIAQKYKDEFVFAREDCDITDRVQLHAQWVDHQIYLTHGFDFEHVDMMATDDSVFDTEDFERFLKTLPKAEAA
jgi:hypothetical protein